jgi:hypothetical protein
MMKEKNFERILKAFTQRRPFKPFIVELASGARFTIDHAEALVHRGRAAMYIDREGNFTLFDNEGVTHLADVTGKGSKRSRRQT